MTFAFGAVLLVVGLLAAVAVVVAVPLLFGLMVWDMAGRRETKVVVAKDESTTRIAAERGVARAFVILGGGFWSVAFFAALYSFRQTGLAAALLGAFIPLVACAATLIVGWYYERFTALLLAAATLAVVAWGVIYQFEMGVWVLMTITLIGPMLTASVLFWLARRDQEAYERLTSVRPELALMFAARSTL